MERALAWVVAAVLGIEAASAQEAVQQAPAPPAPLLPRLTDEVIKDAVKQALAESGGQKAPLDGRVLSGQKYEGFASKFSEAKVPDCLHPDALKLQPSAIETKGWVFGVGGILAAPFWLAAAARGKCR
jgi:hypothetical protein